LHHGGVALHQGVERGPDCLNALANGSLTHHFPFLNLRPSDHPDLVQAVIEGTNDNPRDRVLSLLMIVWRLRNNLFHGAKWAYELRGQRDNFTHANCVLMRMLDRHGQLG